MIYHVTRDSSHRTRISLELQPDRKEALCYSIIMVSNFFRRDGVRALPVSYSCSVQRLHSTDKRQYLCTVASGSVAPVRVKTVESAVALRLLASTVFSTLRLSSLYEPYDTCT